MERTQPPSSTLTRYAPTGSFAETMLGACYQLSASIHTRNAYWSDARRWLQFCEERGVSPTAAKGLGIVVVAWVEQMKKDNPPLAPKTRVRRLSALSAIYNSLIRNGQLTIANPFSAETGPKREKAIVLEPTPAADPDAVKAVLAVCMKDSSPDGLRDEALVRILWATGARRSSLAALTMERLQRDGSEGYTAKLPAKGGKTIRILIQGKAAQVLTRWLAQLQKTGIDRGAIFRFSNGTSFLDRDIWRIVHRRTKEAGIKDRLSPHTFRAAFLTINPASLDAKQDAAGHSDPATTRLYDRNWRGRAAFEAMPEIEDVEGEDESEDK